jgi:hypothetical protein
MADEAHGQSYEAKAAQRYRHYADELRAIAEDRAHLSSRETLLALAAECQQMAANFDAIERANRSVERKRTPH